MDKPMPLAHNKLTHGYGFGKAVRHAAKAAQQAPGLNLPPRAGLAVKSSLGQAFGHLSKLDKR